MTSSCIGIKQLFKLLLAIVCDEVLRDEAIGGAGNDYDILQHMYIKSRCCIP